MSLPRFTQSIGAKLDYSFNWNDGTPSGLVSPETISVSTWTVTHESGPTGTPPVMSLAGIDVAGHVTAVWLTGGLKDSVWLVENTITTSAGRIDTRAFILTIAST